MQLNKKPPLATIIVLAVTGLTTCLQLVSPRILALLERTQGSSPAINGGCLVTPLFAHADGFRQNRL
jgi:hypothetical protein